MASLFDNILNSNDPQLQQQALQLMSQVDNSVQQPQQTSVIPQEVIPQQEVQQPVQQDSSTGRGGVLGFIDNLANVLTDPAVTNSLMAFDASMRGDQQTQAMYNNRYAEVMGQRRAEQAQLQQQKLARQQQLQDQQEQRDWQEKSAYRNALYSTYTPDSVQEYLKSGDSSVLKQQELTPWQQAQIEVRQQNADANTARANASSISKAESNLSNLPSFGAKSREPYQDANGTWYVPKVGSKGQDLGFEVAGAQLQKQLSENKRSGQPSAGEVQMSTDLSTLEKAINNDQVSTFTGNVVGRVPIVGDVLSSTVGTDAERTAQRAAERIDGMMLSQGVADAKAMGASGINTAAEAQMYFRGMPRLDYTSPNALQRSIDDIKSYTQRFNAQKRGATVPESTTQPSNQPSTQQSTPSVTPSNSGITMRRIG